MESDIWWYDHSRQHENKFKVFYGFLEKIFGGDWKKYSVNQDKIQSLNDISLLWEKRPAMFLVHAGLESGFSEGDWINLAKKWSDCEFYFFSREPSELRPELGDSKNTYIVNERVEHLVKKLDVINDDCSDFLKILREILRPKTFSDHFVPFYLLVVALEEDPGLDLSALPNEFWAKSKEALKCNFLDLREVCDLNHDGRDSQLRDYRIRLKSCLEEYAVKV